MGSFEMIKACAELITGDQHNMHAGYICVILVYLDVDSTICWLLKNSIHYIIVVPLQMYSFFWFTVYINHFPQSFKNILQQRKKVSCMHTLFYYFI